MFEVKRQHRRFYVNNVPEYHVDGIPCSYYGPYDDRREAEEDAESMRKFFQKHGLEGVK